MLILRESIAIKKDKKSLQVNRLWKLQRCKTLVANDRARGGPIWKTKAWTASATKVRSLCSNQIMIRARWERELDLLRVSETVSECFGDEGDDWSDLRQHVLASNKLPTYEKPEQHKLHHGRLSWEKKVFTNCHHSGGGEREEEMIDIPLSIADSWTTTRGVALTVGSSGGGCRKMVMKMSAGEV